MSELPSSEDLDPSTGTDAPTPPTTTGPSSYTLNWEEPRNPGGGINQYEQHRAVASRYDKLAVRYEATIHVTAINEWLHALRDTA